MTFRKHRHLCKASEGQPWGSCGSHHRCAISHRRHRQAWGASVCHHQPSWSRTHRVHQTSWTGHLHLQPDGHSSQPCGLCAWQPCQDTHRNFSVSLKDSVQLAQELFDCQVHIIISYVIVTQQRFHIVLVCTVRVHINSLELNQMLTAVHFLYTHENNVSGKV